MTPALPTDWSLSAVPQWIAYARALGACEEGLQQPSVPSYRRWLAATVVRQTRAGEGYDLRAANLAGADLAGADLAGADLNRAALRAADLRGADLRGADLNRADLRGANLHDADLEDARLDDEVRRVILR